MDPITLSLGLVGLVIFIITLVSILRNENQGTGGKVLWIVIAFLLNWIGSLLWIFIGRGKRR